MFVNLNIKWWDYLYDLSLHAFLYGLIYFWQ